MNQQELHVAVRRDRPRPGPESFYSRPDPPLKRTLLVCAVLLQVVDN